MCIFPQSVYVDVGGDHKKRLRDVGELVAKLGHHAYSQRVEGLTGLQVGWANYLGMFQDVTLQSGKFNLLRVLRYRVVLVVRSWVRLPRIWEVPPACSSNMQPQ